MCFCYMDVPKSVCIQFLWIILHYLRLSCKVREYYGHSDAYDISILFVQAGQLSLALEMDLICD